MLTQLLTEVDHERVLLQQRSHNKRRHCLGSVATEEVAGDTLFIMVLKEVEHVILDVVRILPAPSDAVSRTTLTHNIAQAVVHAYLIVEIIEARSDISAILVRVIDFTDKDDMRKAFLDDTRGISPERQPEPSQPYRSGNRQCLYLPRRAEYRSSSSTYRG
jgi:PIN domain nuclease of toxin-antitoxin system